MIVEVEVAATGRERRQGFAAMDPERRRELQAKGGRTAQARGTAHRLTSERAREIGRKGGKARARNARRARARLAAADTAATRVVQEVVQSTTEPNWKPL